MKIFEPVNKSMSCQQIAGPASKSLGLPANRWDCQQFGGHASISLGLLQIDVTNSKSLGLSPNRWD
jgi:hypothetical protein